MAKIVYNSCFGGFGLSRKAILLARQISGDPKWGGFCIKGDLYKDGTVCDKDYCFCDGIRRDDKILVSIVERLGKEANGDCADLQIEEIPAGILWRIDEYDGNEQVMTKNLYEWNVSDW